MVCYLKQRPHTIFGFPRAGRERRGYYAGQSLFHLHPFFFFLPEGESISATFREEMPGDKILTMSDNCYSSIIFSITAVMLTSVPPNHEQTELMVLGDTLDFSS